jgi:hypothetical protein
MGPLQRIERAAYPHEIDSDYRFWPALGAA